MDEAEIRRAEAERQIRLKELELEEKKLDRQEEGKRLAVRIWAIIDGIFIVLSIVLSIAGVGGATLVFMWLISALIALGGGLTLFVILPAEEKRKEKERQLIEAGAIRFPEGVLPADEKKYEGIESMIRSAGFKNVYCVNLHDLNLFQAMVNTGRVECVTVDGKEAEEGELYMPDAPVIISYHGR